MPKHVPSFKHLIATSGQPDNPSKRREKTVGDLLAIARLRTPAVRDDPPHLSSESVWSPGVSAGDTSTSTTLIGIEDGAVHPAELLRRSDVSRRQASRRVAGPAPPPSWQTSSVSTSRSVNPFQADVSSVRHRIVTSQDLTSAAAFFPRSQTPSRLRLVDYCLHAVLKYLDDESLLYEENGDNATCALGWVMREQVAYLEPHLKVLLLDTASSLPEHHPHRLSDRGLKSVLVMPLDLTTEIIDQHHSDTSSATSWDTDHSTTSPIFHHLPLTLHPSPITILRQVPNFPSLALSSLNLAYSTLDLERIVPLLPAGLRELGLCGVRSGTKVVDPVESWRRGLTILGRRLIVLRMLDLSYPSIIKISTNHLTALLHPTASRLPSLRTLGLRGILTSQSQPVNINGRYISTEKGMDVGESALLETKRTLMDAIRGGGRQRYIDVIWE